MAQFDTFLKVQDAVLKRAGWSGTTRRTYVKDAINEAGHAIFGDYRHAPWRKKVGTIVTVEPYVTGTVSTSGATVTGVGTTFASGMVGRKFVSDYGQPFFIYTTHTDANNFDLEQDWPFTDLSGSGYVIFQDTYSLASDCEFVLLDEITLHDSDGHKMASMSVTQGLEGTHLPRQAGMPERLVIVEEDSSGNPQVQLWPNAPDQVYVIRYAYMKSWTELAGDSDVPDIPSNHGDLLVKRALMVVGEHPEFRNSPMLQQYASLYQKALARVMGNKRVSPQVAPASTYDGRTGRRRRYPFSFPIQDN